MKTKRRDNSTILGRVKRLFPKVTQVVDGTSNLAIEVTTADASSKAVRNHKECAMAHAVRRTLQAEGAIINATTAYVVKGNVATRYMLPDTVTREVTSFDRQAGFATGEYHLRRPSRSRRITAPNRTSSNTTKNGKKPLQPYHLTTNIRRVSEL